MDNAAAMSVGESARDVLEDADRLTNRERTASHARAHGLAIHIRHDEIRQLIGLARAEHGHDMRMLQRGREHDLALEAIDGDAGRELPRQHLDHDLTAERVVGGDEDDRHATATELTLDGVGGPECPLDVFANVSHCYDARMNAPAKNTERDTLQTAFVG